MLKLLENVCNVNYGIQMWPEIILWKVVAIFWLTHGLISSHVTNAKITHLHFVFHKVKQRCHCEEVWRWDFFQDPALITNIWAGGCCWCYQPENKSHFLTSSCFVRKGTDQAKYQLPYLGIHKETAKFKFVFEIFEIYTVP